MMAREGIWRIAAPLATLLIVGGILGGAYYAWNALHAPQAAPEIHLQSTGYEAGQQGSPINITLADYHGRTLLIDFMGVSCTACRFVEKDVLRPVYAKYGNRTDFAILSIDAWAGFAGEGHDELVGFQRSQTMPWRYALDTDQALTKFGGFGIPKLVLIDPDGKVVMDADGEATFNQVDSAIQKSIAGIAAQASVLQAGLVTLGFVAGAASFLAPCCIGMLPAYFGFLLNTTTDQPRPRALARGTALMGVGILSVYAVLAALLAVAGASLRHWIPLLAPVLAVLIIATGMAMLLGFDWTRLGRRKGADNPRGFYGFGLAYGLAAFGCTGPAFLPIIGAGFLESVPRGLAVFAAFAVAILIFLGLASALVAVGDQSLWRRLMAHTKTIQRVSAALMIAGGAYVLWFYIRATT